MRQGLNPQEIHFIEAAAAFLEKPSALVRATDQLGKPLDRLQSYLPLHAQQVVNQALEIALHMAIISLPEQQPDVGSWDSILESTRRTAWKHTAAATTTGAISGAIGSAAMLVELPFTTGLMLRSISSMARQWGHDLRQPEIQLQCLYVFTLGSPLSRADDQLDAAYISARLAWQGVIKELAGFISAHSAKDVVAALEHGTLPALVKFATLLFPSLERVLAKSVLAKGLPILSAVGSAALNAGFSRYFSQAARYHFGLMHLEAKYGPEVVHQAYGYAHQAEARLAPLRKIS